VHKSVPKPAPRPPSRPRAGFLHSLRLSSLCFDGRRGGLPLPKHTLCRGTEHVGPRHHLAPTTRLAAARSLRVDPAALPPPREAGARCVGHGLPVADALRALRALRGCQCRGFGISSDYPDRRPAARTGGFLGVDARQHGVAKCQHALNHKRRTRLHQKFADLARSRVDIPQRDRRECHSGTPRRPASTGRKLRTGCHLRQEVAPPKISCPTGTPVASRKVSCEKFFGNRKRKQEDGGTGLVPRRTSPETPQPRMAQSHGRKGGEPVGP